MHNPMYFALVANVAGQASVLGSAALLAYALLLWLVFHLWVVVYEEPTLHARFGASFYYASLVHDALYQFLPDGLPLSRA